MTRAIGLKSTPRGSPGPVLPLSSIGCRLHRGARPRRRRCPECRKVARDWVEETGRNAHRSGVGEVAFGGHVQLCVRMTMNDSRALSDELAQGHSRQLRLPGFIETESARGMVEEIARINESASARRGLRSSDRSAASRWARRAVRLMSGNSSRFWCPTVPATSPAASTSSTAAVCGRSDYGFGMGSRALSLPSSPIRNRTVPMPVGQHAGSLPCCHWYCTTTVSSPNGTTVM
jgi:hypothetical protein